MREKEGGERKLGKYESVIKGTWVEKEFIEKQKRK
jgi:hypothetical protein